MRTLITYNPATEDYDRAVQLKRYIQRYGGRVDIVPESEHTRIATSEIDRQEQLEHAYKWARSSWGGPDNDPFMDWTGARDFLQTTAMTDHDPECRWRGSNGRIFCTCDVLKNEYFRRASEAVVTPAP